MHPILPLYQNNRNPIRVTKMWKPVYIVTQLPPQRPIYPTAQYNPNPNISPNSGVHTMAFLPTAPQRIQPFIPQTGIATGNNRTIQMSPPIHSWNNPISHSPAGLPSVPSQNGIVNGHNSAINRVTNGSIQSQTENVTNDSFQSVTMAVNTQLPFPILRPENNTGVPSLTTVTSSLPTASMSRNSSDVTLVSNNPTDIQSTEQPSVSHSHTRNVGTVTGYRKKYWNIIERVNATNHSNEEKPFECPHPQCEIRSISKRSLLSHYRRHTEFAYVCNICNARFSNKSHLTYHLRIHSGEKPYECHICHKRLSQKHNLTAHLRMHSPENLVKCQYCQKTFVSVGNKNEHIRKVCTIYKALFSNH